MKKKYTLLHFMWIALCFCFMSSQSMAQIDAELSSLNSPQEGTLCTTVISPDFDITNTGVGTIALLFYTYQLDDAPPVQQIWTGSLGEGETINIVLPPINLSAGAYNFTVTIGNVNNQPDANPTNNEQSVDFTIASGQSLSVELTTDQYGEETSFNITDADGNVLYAEPMDEFADGETFNFDFCLGEGCYVFNIFDQFGDGICCGYGDGSYTLTNPLGEVLGTGGDYGQGESVDFCLETIILSDFDGSLTQVVAPDDEESCKNNITPTVILRNEGNAILTSATITYALDGVVADSFDWAGLLNSFQTATITFPEAVLTGGDYNISFAITSLNGEATDDVADNNEIAKDFSIIEGEEITLLLEGASGFQNYYTITNNLGEEVVYFDDFPGGGGGGNLTEAIHCLQVGCYTFDIYDEFGNGLTVGGGGGGGGEPGSINIFFADGSNVFIDGDFGESTTYDFCVGGAMLPAIDAGIANVLNVQGNTSCATSVNPELVVKNFGQEVLSSFSGSYQIDGGASQTFDWTGTLSTSETANVMLSSIEGLVVGIHELSIEITSVNGDIDNVLDNNNKTIEFIINEGFPLNIDLSTAAFQFIEFELLDADGNDVYYTTDFPNDADVALEYCVVPGECYTLIAGGGFGGGGGGGDNSFTATLFDGTVVGEDDDIGDEDEYEFCVTNVELAALNAAITNILVPTEGTYCAETLVPVIQVQNLSENTVITSMVISYQIDGQMATEFDWTGTLSVFGTADITLPELAGLTIGSYTFSAEIISVNGSVDDVADDNAQSVSFTLNDGQQVEIVVVTSQSSPDQNSYTIKDLTTGNIVAEYEDFLALETNSQTFCIPDGCYVFTILDENDNGILNGSITISLPDGQEFFIDGLFGSEASQVFCIGEVDLPAYDVKVISLEAFSPACAVAPFITVYNGGLEAVNSLTIVYEVDGGDLQTYDWTGTINMFEEEKIALPSFTPTAGSYDLIATVISINGNPDETPDDNSGTTNVTVITGTPITLDLQTDNWGEEISFELTDENGNVVAEDGNLEDNAFLNYQFCIEPGCFTMTVFDTYGDGGATFTFTDVFGNVLAESENYTDLLEIEFCVESLYELDGQVLGLISPNAPILCSNNITPSLEFRNLGTTPITTAEFAYGLNGTTETYTWEGTLTTYANATITLPNIADIPVGDHSFEVTLVSINGSTDEESNNNAASFGFSVTDGAGIVVALTTDAFASEASYTISDDMDNVVYTSQEYDEGFTTFEAPYCLENACYTFTLIDQFGDGGASYEVFDNAGELLGAGGGPDFGESESFEFCLEGDSTDTSLDAMNFADNISIYPNPTVAQVIINHNFATLLTATLTDLSGRELLKAELSSSSSTLLLPKNISAGLYLLELTDGQNQHVQKLIVE